MGGGATVSTLQGEIWGASPYQYQKQGQKTELKQLASTLPQCTTGWDLRGFTLSISKTRPKNRGEKSASFNFAPVHYRVRCEGLHLININISKNKKKFLQMVQMKTSPKNQGERSANFTFAPPQAETKSCWECLSGYSILLNIK